MVPALNRLQRAGGGAREITTADPPPPRLCDRLPACLCLKQWWGLKVQPGSTPPHHPRSSSPPSPCSPELGSLLPVLAPCFVDVPVGASPDFAALVLEQILHPFALGRQLGFELVVHVSHPWKGAGRKRAGSSGSKSVRRRNTGLPHWAPFPCFGEGGGESALRRHPLQQDLSFH